MLATRTTLTLDLEGCDVDVLRLLGADLDALTPAALQALADLCAGPLLEDLAIDRCPHFDAWLAEQR